MSGLIGHQDSTGRIHSQDSGGAAFDECFQLLFSVAPQQCLLLNLSHVLRRESPVFGGFMSEECSAKVGSEHEDVAGNPCCQIPRIPEGGKEFGQKGTQSSQYGELPAQQATAHDQHGKKI